MSIRKLIDETYWHIEAVHAEWLVDVYYADIVDFKAVQYMIDSNDIDGAIARIERMDTESRDQLILAIADEYGNGYVETVIGHKTVA